MDSMAMMNGIPTENVSSKRNTIKKTAMEIEQQAPQRTHGSLSDLPEAMSKEMLKYLSIVEILTIEQVDKTWERVVSEMGCWRTLVIHHDQDEEKNDRVIEQVARRHGAQVKRLELVDSVFSNELIMRVGHLFTQMNELVVSGCKMVSDKAFAVLTRASHQSLVEIRAVKCPMLTDASLEIVSSYQGQSLLRIDFSHCRLLTSAGVSVLVEKCKKLQSIGFKGCPKVNDVAILAIAARCKNLQLLAVGGSGNVTDNALHALADDCRSLKSLDISRSNPFGMGRGGVTDQGLLHLVTNCPKLERLVLRGQGRLSLSVLASLSTHSLNLESLDIGGCRSIMADPAALCAELKRMSVLQKLSVSFSRGLSESHISSIAAECPQLKTFDVDGERIPVVCA